MEGINFTLKRQKLEASSMTYVTDLLVASALQETHQGGLFHEGMKAVVLDILCADEIKPN